MKKKLVKTLALALALSMIPVMAYGASSSPKNDDDDSSSSESVYEDKTVGGDGTSGTAITQPSRPSVVVSPNGQQTSVGQTSKDSSGVTMSLVVNKTTEDGKQVSMQFGGGAVVGDQVVTIATGAAETAGLPEGVVNVINQLNKGTGAETAIPDQDMTGYKKLGNTRALIVSSQSTGKTDAVATEVTLQVSGINKETRKLVAVGNGQRPGLMWPQVRLHSSLPVPVPCSSGGSKTDPGGFTAGTARFLFSGVRVR